MHVAASQITLFYVCLTDIVQCCKAVSVLPLLLLAYLQLPFFVPRYVRLNLPFLVHVFVSVVQVSSLEGKDEKVLP